MGGYGSRYSVGPDIAVGNGMKGAALINRGQIEPGIELLSAALAKLKADRYELYVPGLCLALAARNGRTRAQGLHYREYWSGLACTIRKSAAGRIEGPASAVPA